MSHTFYGKITYYILFILFFPLHRFKEQCATHAWLCREWLGLSSHDLHIARNISKVLWPITGPRESVQVSGGSHADTNRFSLGTAAASLDILSIPSFPLGITNKRGGPLPLILNLPSSQPHTPFLLPAVDLNTFCGADLVSSWSS